MLEQLIAILGSELEFTATEVADLLWLTLERHKRDKTVSSPATPTQDTETKTPPQPPSKPPIETTQTPVTQPSPETKTPAVEVYAATQTSTSPTTEAGYVPLSVPDAPSLREPLDFIRALKPLLRQVASSTEQVIDESATVDWIAQTDLWMPQLQPALEPWLELALVIDESESMILWRHAVNELQRLLKHYGMFRDVRVWGMGRDKTNRVYLRSQTRFHSPRELIDPRGRRLIVLVSDCVDSLWYQGKILSWLQDWTASNPVAVLQMLPHWLWSRAALGQSIPAQFRGLVPGTINQNLQVEASSFWKPIELETGIKLPVLNFEPERAKSWSQMLAGQGEARTSGYVLREDLLAASTAAKSAETPTARERVSDFTVNASPLAQRLAGLLAAAPMITMPVVRLIQDSMLEKSRQIQVAEVFLGGLLQPIGEITPETNPEQVQYEFIDGVRGELLKSVPVPDGERVLDSVSRHVAKKLGKTLREFVAWLRNPEQIENEAVAATVKPFARVTQEILQQLGYEVAAEEEATVPVGAKGLSPVQDGSLPQQDSLDTYSFEVVYIDTDTVRANADAVGATDAVRANTDEVRANGHSPLLTFTFQTVTVNRKGEIINTETKTAQYFTEDLALRLRSGLDGIALRQAQGSALDMVYIPGGTFLMGTEDEEIERLCKKYDMDYLRRERPQHKVTVQPFFMGKYPITQGQWKAVANMTHLKVNRDLDPEPSEFKDDPPKSLLKRGTSESSFEQEAGEETFTRWDRPVEQVSWDDAVEFCQRLSQLTGQDYRLPTEAEWEYACRGMTSDRSENLPYPPFHFGKTLTDKLANYRANSIYAEEPKGEERRETTAVGHFPPNAFGLYDMHGNVWEWCEDDYHGSYVDAPTDGSAWRSGDKSTTKILRGGCWDYFPSHCRCAYRNNYGPDYSSSDIGFRVVRAAR